MKDKPTKKILFYYDNYSGEGARGGTEVATARIANALKQEKWTVFHAFRNGEPITPETLYEAVVKLPKHGSRFVSRLSAFIQENGIDVIVNMSRFFRHKKLKTAIESSGLDVKLLFMHHFAPGSETTKTTYSAALHLLKLAPLNPRYGLRALFYPLIKLPRRLQYKQAYAKVYEQSDGIILLSEGYIPVYQKYADIEDQKKFTVIPNIYDPPAASKTDFVKEKRVLILSRMDEIQKRITLALAIWKKIEACGDLDDWHLDIVGNGHDMGLINRQAKRMGLKNATFYGWQDGVPFLKRASILMMTSLYEGLSLSMIEAQTFGAVPVAFHSYASLTDIVEDEKTGVAVAPFGDIDKFADKLASLMRNENRLYEMRVNGKAQSEKFSSKAIASRWQVFLNDLMA